MKKLYDEFFRIPQNGNIREKVMLTRVVTTVVIIVACLVAMSFTAYAYFSCNITSTVKNIKAVSFETIIHIQDVDDDSKSVTVEGTAKSANLLKDRTYRITIDEDENSTASTGYVAVSYTGCSEEYHTQQLGKDANADGGRTDKITFELKVTKDTTVYFEDNWGTSSLYSDYVNGNAVEHYITNGNVGANLVEMVIDQVVGAIDENSATPTPEVTQAPVVTQTPTVEPTPKATQTPEATPVITQTPAVTQTPIATPEVTQTPVVMPTATPDATQAPVVTPTATPDATQTPETEG